jgi:hypothetical protein
MRSARLLLILGLLLTSTSHAFADAKLVERVKVEAPKGWEDYAMASKMYQGQVFVEKVDNKTQEKLWAFEYNFKRNGCWLVTTSKGLVKNRNAVTVGKNSKYAFKLQQNNPEDGWALVAFDSVPADGISNVVGLDCENHKKFSDTALAPLYLYSTYLPDLLPMPGVTIVDARPRDVDGARLIECAISYNPPQKSQTPIRKATVLLDPEHMWILRGYSFDGEWSNAKGMVTAELVYARLDESPILKKIIRHDLMEGVGPGSDGTCSSHFMMSTIAAPESEFKLSAFGLPEPEGENNLFLYLGSSGIGLSAVYLMLRMFMRLKQ